MLPVVLFFAISITFIEASHFRGGTINWKPTNIANEVEFRFKLGWTYGNGAGCNESLIGEYVTTGGEASGSWICTKGCQTQIILSNTSYICTGASRSENWEQGEYTFKYKFPDKGPFTIGFSSSAWMTLSYGSAGSWNVETVVDLRTRNDSKRLNSSPISGSRPMYRLQYGCNNTLTLPMTDADGDIIKCRWSRGSECASVCNGLPNASLDTDTCTLTFYSTTANQYQTNGWYAVALTIEDYPRSAISMGGTTILPTTPISSVPIQFLINTPSMSGSCQERPIFVNNTPPENQLLVIKASQSLNIRFYAASKFGITDMTLMSPAGLQKSALINDDLGRPDVSYIVVTWTPKQTDRGAHLLCGTAEDTQGKMSVPRCLTVLAWVIDPCHSTPCQNNGTCKRVGVTADYNCICGPGYTGVLCGNSRY
ncbi:hypothetical protein KUTeg_012949 [Tegillarca granosa]|uniref:EGF-like domain-containing protein n=1 Tax=Tegillarca granosa TaxID=220873 RepID=A0ABQ9ESC1_TEGGR|nr:hypothetical protein KUTeg_012949 [Tegillarca granosa]